MASIAIEARFSTEQLLQAVEQLPEEELEAFVDRLVEVRARRREPRLSGPESALLLQINEGIAPAEQRRFDELVAKRQAEAITLEELDDLMELTEHIERHDAQRLAALDALAALRRVPLADLMDALGIRPRANA